MDPVPDHESAEGDMVKRAIAAWSGRRDNPEKDAEVRD